MINRTSLSAILAGAALAACTGGDGDGPGTVIDAGVPDAAIDEWEQKLDERQYDYPAALRIAALRLVGDLPTNAEMTGVATAGDVAAQKAAYEARVTAYMADPRFARQIFAWWQDTLKLGDDPEFDSAAAFAAQLTVENRPFTELFTATAGQCGSYDMGLGTFTAANCTNGATQAGLLTHPGMMRQFFGNMAFRRVRWVQETFACTKFPAEVGPPIEVGGIAPYTGLFPFESLPNGTTVGRLNFQDASAVVCANCHATMNRLAPLFAMYDDQGAQQAQIAVPTPLPGAPVTEFTDYLAAGEATAWRFGVNTPDLPALGAALANDPDTAECQVARVWNWALGKGDIVDSLREVPTEVIATQIADFAADGYQLKDLIFAVFTADDFVKF